MDRPELGLDHLFIRTRADLNDPFIVFFARFGNAQDMLSRRNVSKHHAARAADTSLSLIIYIDLSINGSENDETRSPGAFLLFNIFRRLLESRYPLGNG